MQFGLQIKYLFHSRILGQNRKVNPNNKGMSNAFQILL